MKKALLLVMALMLCFALVGCGNNNDTPVNNDDVVNPSVDDVNSPVEPDLNDDMNDTDPVDLSGELEMPTDISGEIVSGEVSGEIAE